MNQRLDQLDSLRGLAALTVVLSHFAQIFPIICETIQPGSSWWLNLVIFTPIHIVWAGHESVVFFFVLSGFVLSLPFLKEGKNVPYFLYLIKRILRIYSPYILAVGSVFILREWLYRGDLPDLSTWFNAPWRTPVDWGVILNHCLLIGSYKNCSFDPVLWSLVHEMRISIIFPLLIFLVRFRGKTAIGIAVGFSLLCHLMVRLKHFGVVSYEHDYFWTLHYVGMFTAGGFLAKYRISIVDWIGNLEKGKKLLILGVALLAYTNSFWLPYYGTFKIHFLELLFMKTEFQEWLTTAGVAAIISLSLGTRSGTAFLSWKVVRYLGRISYSLYLFHAICLIAVVRLLYLQVPIWSALVIAFAASLLVSTASYYFVEIPSINLGKRLTQRWINSIAGSPLRKRREAGVNSRILP